MGDHISYFVGECLTLLTGPEVLSRHLRVASVQAARVPCRDAGAAAECLRFGLAMTAGGMVEVHSHTSAMLHSPPTGEITITPSAAVNQMYRRFKVFRPF
jgi:hypothetical protein